MTRRIASLAALVGLLGTSPGCGEANKYAAPPPPEVTVRKPLRKNVATYLEYSGVTQAIASVELRARVKGFLKEKKFRDGDDVKAGQLLLVIDEDEFRARAEQAEAKLAEAQAALKKAQTSKAREVARAQLALDQAALILAQIELSRQKSLFSRNAAAQQDIDRADANQKKSQAQVEADQAALEQANTDYDVNILSAQASIAGAKADLEKARIDLGYCRIASPVNGHISRSFVDPGNLVGDGQATVLATVLSDDEMYAYVSISESDILRFREMRAAGKRADYRKDAIPLELGLLNEKGFPHKGRVEYSDPGVDPTTGTVQARGIFPNTDHTLVSGAFVRVRVPFETKADALLVPLDAVGSDAVGPFVLVVGPGDKVERRKVVVGPEADGERVIESGLDGSERVVINGLQRARPGSAVRPVEAGAAPSDAKPAPRGVARS